MTKTMRDSDVRKAVRAMLNERHAGDLDTRIVEEMGIWSGSVRVDVAVINGELHGFELKSARDTLERLPRQASLYNEVFDRVTLVVAPNHIVSAADHIPDWWGIARADDAAMASVTLTDVRPAEPNPNLRPLQVARLLWRSEAMDVLARRNLLTGFRSKSADTLAQRLADQLPIDELRYEVRTVLKGRQNWLSQVAAGQVEMTVEPEGDPRFSVA